MGNDHRTARSAQRLMGREGDDIGDAHRVRISTGDHQPGYVGNVGHQIRAHFIGNVAEFLEIRRKGIAAVARQ